MISKDKKMIIIMLMICSLILMGCSDNNDLKNKQLNKSNQDMCELIHFNHVFGQIKYKYLERNLVNFCDSKKELKYIVKGITDFVEKLDDFNIEYLSAMDKDYNLVCNHFSSDEENNVDLCLRGKDIGLNSSLLFVIHNHPSNNPLQSESDVFLFSKYNVKYNIVFTQKNGIFILKNDGADEYDIQRGWEDTFQKMNNCYKRNNLSSYNGEYIKYINGLISRKELKNNLTGGTFKHMGSNIDKGIAFFSESMEKHNVKTLYINPKF